MLITLCYKDGKVLKKNISSFQNDFNDSLFIFNQSGNQKKILLHKLFNFNLLIKISSVALS